MTDQSYPQLFNVFPDLKERLSWIALVEAPTPLERLAGFPHSNLWIKRDDLTSSFYGGNKVRKLEFILADVLERGKDRVVTMGGLGTNHGLATTLFCYRNGLDTTLLLSDQPVTPHVKRHLRLFHRYGAEMVYAGSSLNTYLRFHTLERIRRFGAYFLPSGGSTPVGVLGFVNAVFELQSQLEKHAVDEPDYIFCPLGSNGTLAGISLGLALAGMRTKPVGVRVIDSHLGGILPVATSGTVMRLMKRAYRYLRSFTEMLPEITLTPPRIIEDFFGEGYGAPTEQSRRAREVMQSTAGLPLDPTYTAKTFAAVLDFISAPEHAEDSVLYWHTFSAEERHDEAEEVDYEELPSEFHRFFEGEVVAE